MPDFTVRKYDIDSSGRPIYMTAFMADWWKQVTDELGFVPTIIQGAFMARAGGGTAASAGYHDAGGCLNLRTWDRTPSEVDRMVRTLRRYGAAAWVRGARHGMDPHLHFVLGADRPLASGAARQWADYLAGYDGLASRGRDYHWRPDPIVTAPPEVDPMADYATQLDTIQQTTARIERIVTASRERERRTLELLRKVRKQVADDATRRDIDRLIDALTENAA